MSDLGGWLILAGEPPAPAPIATSFTSASDNIANQPITLVVLDLRAYGGNPALTLRLSTVPFRDPDDYPYNALLEGEPDIDAGGRLLENKWQPADCRLTLRNERLFHQSISENVTDLLSDYELVGTKVTVYQAYANLTSTADYLQVFEGEIAEPADISNAVVTLIAVQERKWDDAFPPNVINKNDYPNAPEESMGLARPWIYGDHETDRLYLTVSGGGGLIEAALAGAGRGGFPIIQVDQAQTTDKHPVFLVADHAMKSLPSRILADLGTDALASSADPVTVVNTGPATLGLTSRNFHVPIRAVNKNATNNATAWENLLRQSRTYLLNGPADLDYTAGRTVLGLLIGDQSALGTLLSGSLFVFYAKNASTAPRPYFWMFYGGAFLDDAQEFEDAASGHPNDAYQQFASIALDPAKFTSWEKVRDMTMGVTVRASGQKVQVHQLILVVKCAVQGRLLRRGSAPRVEWTWRDRKWYAPRGRPIVIKNPDVYDYGLPAMGFGKGRGDDGSGTYTGTVGGLIEQPADVAKHLLRVAGGLAATNVESGAGQLGTFGSARLSGYKMAAHYGARGPLEKTIEDIAGEYLIWFNRALTKPGAKWMAFPWQVGLTANYRSASGVFKFSRHWIEETTFRCWTTPIKDVRNVVRVNYDYDINSRQFLRHVFISDTDSRGWNGTTEVRHQNGSAPNNRESRAAASVAAYGRREYVHNMETCRDPATATDVLHRLFDFLYRPRVNVEFGTHANAADLERGHIIEIDADRDTTIRFPVPGSDGSWAGKGMWVTSKTRRRNLPTAYMVRAVDVVA